VENKWQNEVDEHNGMFTRELEENLKKKILELPQPFALGQFVEILESAEAPRMTGKVGKIVSIAPKFDLYERNTKIPDWVTIPDGELYIEVPRWEIIIEFPLGNTRAVDIKDIKVAELEDANKGTQGINEGKVHLVNKNLRQSDRKEIIPPGEEPKEIPISLSEEPPPRAGFGGKPKEGHGTGLR
tara:strand:- start:14581 stop:15135 length:555 start_codon:yes stop_codon:yes gene_type:complete